MSYLLLIALRAIFTGSLAFANHVFIGSIVSNNETSSIAVFAVTGEAGTIEARIGSEVAGWTVEKIDYGMVSLKKDRLRILLRQNDEVEEEAKSRRLFIGIKRRGDTVVVAKEAKTFFLKEGLVRALFEAAVEPKFSPTGEPIGFELYDIDRGSIYELIGLKNHDVVAEIDGTPLKTPALAIKKLSDLKNLDRFSFKVLSGSTTKTVLVSVD